MQRINFFSADLLPQRQRFDFRQLLFALPVVFVLLIIVWCYHFFALRHLHTLTQQQQTKLEQLLNDVQQKQASVAAEQPLLPLIELQEQLKQRQAFLYNVQKQSGSLQGFSQVLDALAQQAQPSIWLTGIYVDARVLQFKGATLKPDQMPDWIAQLQQLPALQNAHFSQLELQRDGDKPILIFDLNGQLP